MKTAVSLSDDLFERAEALRAARGYSRSQLYALALEFYIAQQPEDPLTVRINKVLEENASADDKAPTGVNGRRLIEQGQWEW